MSTGDRVAVLWHSGPADEWYAGTMIAQTTECSSMTGTSACRNRPLSSSVERLRHAACLLKRRERNCWPAARLQNRFTRTVGIRTECEPKIDLPAPASPFDDVDAEQIARYLLAACFVVFTAIDLEWVWWLRIIAFVVIGFFMADYGVKTTNRRASSIGLGLLAMLLVLLGATRYHTSVLSEQTRKIIAASGPQPPLLAQAEKEITCGDDWPVCSSRDYPAALEHYTTWAVSNGIAPDANDALTVWVTSEIGTEKAQAAIARGRAASGAPPS